MGPHQFLYRERSWSTALPYQPLAAQKLPDGLGFDKFSLLVRSTYTIASFESGVDASGLAVLDEAGRVDAVVDAVRDTVDEILAAASEGDGGGSGQNAAVAGLGIGVLGDIAKVSQMDHERARAEPNPAQSGVPESVQEGRQCPIRRRNVNESVNPIEPDDLVNLKAWSYKDPYIKKKDRGEIALPFKKPADKKLPAGFGFDKFGLLVRKEQQQPGSVPEGGVDVEVRNRQNTTHRGHEQIGAEKKHQQVKAGRWRKDTSANKPVARPGGGVISGNRGCAERGLKAQGREPSRELGYRNDNEVVCSSR